jgi:succinoglycan biosynthesis protein ExoM
MQDRVVIIVVDNDVTVDLGLPDRLEAPASWPVVVLEEPVRGIPRARNRALVEARRIGAGLIAFLDDDEVPDPGWLAELVRRLAASGADAAVGPVRPAFAGSPPDWVVAGGFFDRPSAVDGQDITSSVKGGDLRAALRSRTRGSLPVPSTNNALVTSDLVDAVDGFDPRLALTGGSDREFFARAAGLGYRFVWADRAAVAETIPRSRQTVGWLARRHYRLGSNSGRRATSLPDSVGVLAAGFLGLAYGPLRAALGAALGHKEQLVQGALTTCRAAGLVAGWFGHAYEEYRTPSTDA